MTSLSGLLQAHKDLWTTLSFIYSDSSATFHSDFKYLELTSIWDTVI